MLPFISFVCFVLITLTTIENGYCQIPTLQQLQLDKQSEVGQQSITGGVRQPFGEIFGTEAGTKLTGEQKSLSEQTWKGKLSGESSGKRSDKLGGDLPTGTDIQKSFGQQQLLNDISAKGLLQQGTSGIEAQEALGEISRAGVDKKKYQPFRTEEQQSQFGQAIGTVQQPLDQIYGARTQQGGLGLSTSNAQQLGMQPFGQPMQQLSNDLLGLGTYQPTGVLQTTRQQQPPFGPFDTGVQQASVFGTQSLGFGAPAMGAQQLGIGPFEQQAQQLFNELFGTGSDHPTGESLGTGQQQPQFGPSGSAVQQPFLQTYGSEIQRSGFGGPTQGGPFGQQEQLVLNELLGIDQPTGELSPTRQQQPQFGPFGMYQLQPLVQPYGSDIQQQGLAAPSVGLQQLGNGPLGTASQQMLNKVFGIEDQKFPTGERQPQLALPGIGMQQPQQFGESIGTGYQPSVNTNQLSLVGSTAMGPNKQGGNEEMLNKQPLAMFGQVSNIQPIQQIPNNQRRMGATLEVDNRGERLSVLPLNKVKRSS